MRLALYFIVNYLYLDPPRLKIYLGRNLNVSNIKEGSDVYFECTIDASPSITRLDWDHNVSIIIRIHLHVLNRFNILCSTEIYLIIN